MSTDDHFNALGSTDGLAEWMDRSSLRVGTVDEEDETRQPSCIRSAVAERSDAR